MVGRGALYAIGSDPNGGPLRIRLRSRPLVVVGVAALLAGGCRGESAHPAGTPAADSTRAPILIGDTLLPSGPLGVSARRGLALMEHTPDSLPQYARSALRCMSCHLDDGRRAKGLPLVGTFARYPQYRARDGRVDLITDRVNDCFQRSLNGKPLPVESSAMRDIIVYLAWVSRRTRVLDSGVAAKRPVLVPDTARGHAIFATICAQCHGADGNGGTYLGPVPPLWGNRSFNIGAGMARLRTIAAFVRYNMPFNHPGTLTDQQAFDVAAFVISRPRPDYPGKEKDWPNGDPPPDVAYPTAAAARKAAARSTPTGAH